MIDLHTHSTCSDGSDKPHRVVELAHESGCRAVALTDHDTVEGIARATMRASELGIELIAGVELSCHTSDRNVHILGYFVDHHNTKFLERLQTQQTLRQDRNARLVERLNELGIEISYKEVLQMAGSGTIGRPHFAAVLVRHGYVETIDEAFLRFLADGAPAFVERRELPASEGIRWITEAGGVACWAHPEPRGFGGAPRLEETLEELCAAGLVGLEAWYARYDSEQRQRLRRIAKHYELIATGGSDYHGNYKPDLAIGVGLGDLSVPYAVISELRARIT